ncbi:MAG: RES domain-containing protein [Deltaproteobacteria bacterium]|nr:RES domain-containing protein [Deltaproteobacteria bacterium]
MPLRAVRVCARTLDPLHAGGRPNRWNASGQRVLYLAEHFATSVLETVVHVATTAPPPAHAKWVTIGDDIAVTEFTEADLPRGWDDPDDQTVARAVGAEWANSGASACLIVPSVPGHPYERNIVLNTEHPDFAKLGWEATELVPWDPRLFG